MSDYNQLNRLKTFFDDSACEETPTEDSRSGLDSKVLWPRVGQSLLGRSLQAFFEDPDDLAAVAINENAYAVLISLWDHPEGRTMASLSELQGLSATEVDDGIYQLREGCYVQRIRVIRRSPDGVEIEWPAYCITPEFRQSQEYVLDELEELIEEGEMS